LYPDFSYPTETLFNAEVFLVICEVLPREASLFVS